MTVLRRNYVLGCVQTRWGDSCTEKRARDAVIRGRGMKGINKWIGASYPCSRVELDRIGVVLASHDFCLLSFFSRGQQVALGSFS